LVRSGFDGFPQQTCPQSGKMPGFVITTSGAIPEAAWKFEVPMIQRPPAMVLGTVFVAGIATSVRLGSLPSQLKAVSVEPPTKF
jgi:hypothetical protein